MSYALFLQKLTGLLRFKECLFSSSCDLEENSKTHFALPDLSGSAPHMPAKDDFLGAIKQLIVQKKYDKMFS